MEERQPATVLTDDTTAEWDATQSRVLDAADTLLQRGGVHGVTVAALARRSQLSRPTIYRTWRDADDVVRAALLRRVSMILESLPVQPRNRETIVADVLAFSARFRSDAVYARMLEDEPESFTRYTLRRIGSSQRMILRWLTSVIEQAQRGGSVRPGEARPIAVMTMLITQAAVLSHGTVSEMIDEADWERELRAALDGLLRP